MNTATDLQQWMIYGANGYTGRLIAEEAAHRGIKPILAGRSLEKIKPLADKLGLPYRVFDLPDLEDDSQNILEGIALVLLCAGPFSQTSKPFVSACVKKGIHYLDITGEIAVLEAVLSGHSEAQTAGSVLIPGVGFDVVPSDCLAAALSKKLPGAHSLELAFAGSASLSPGTLKTMVENLPHGGKIRENGIIRSVPNAYKSKQVKFPFGTIWVSSIPWGDVSTAFHSTKIPNITTYAPVPRAMIRMQRAIALLSPLLANKFVQSGLKALVEKTVHGPTEEQRKTAKMYLWGSVKKGSDSAEGWLTIPEGYHFTMLAALKSVERVLAGSVKPGAYTPSMAFGAEFIDSFPEAQLQFSI